MNHGPELDFIFDTGADTCVLTELGRAKMTQLKFDGHRETLGSGGATDQPTSNNVDLTLAGRTWSEQSLMFIDFKGALRADGVIGYNLFSRNVIGIDFDRSTMTVWNALDAPPADHQSIDVTVRGGLAFIPIQIGAGSNQTTDMFAVDTGFGGTATVTASTARSAGLPGNLEQLGTGKMGGTGNGSVDVAKVRLPILSIGRISMAGIPVDVQLSEPRSFKTWNIVGTELIRRFNVVWNIPSRKMYFKQNRHFADTFATPSNGSRRLALLVGSVVLLVAAIVLVRMVRSSKVVLTK